MVKKAISRKQIIAFNILAIFLAAVCAIVGHSAVPSTTNVENFDSIFVILFSFPVVASFYFILIYVHCAIVTQYFGKQANTSKLQIGIRFGLSFAMIYLLGMQEVVVEASPYSTWGIDFIIYEFFMGISDAIPAFLLCLIAAHINMKGESKVQPMYKLEISKKITAIALISFAFLLERAVGYETGFISSDCAAFPIPCYAWTVLFGAVLGCAYAALYPIFCKDSSPLRISFNLMVLTIGLNWIIFNSFIGLIFDEEMLPLLIRSGTDVIVLFLASIVINVYFDKNKHTVINGIHMSYI